MKVNITDYSGEVAESITEERVLDITKKVIERMDITPPFESVSGVSIDNDALHINFEKEDRDVETSIYVSVINLGDSRIVQYSLNQFDKDSQTTKEVLALFDEFS